MDWLRLKLYVSNDRAISFEKHDLPKYSLLSRSKLFFNKANSSTFIWSSEEGCQSIFSSSCKVKTYITKDYGASFDHLVDNVSACRFLGSFLNSTTYDIDENLIVCDQRSSTGMALSLISSSDYFKSETETVFPSIIGSTETGEFLVVARLNDDNSLTAFITADGKNYAEAKFPADVKVDKQTAYTVLDVRSKQIFLHVTTSAKNNREFGALLKSNYNGTMYVQSIDHVNRNFAGYIDFESIQSLEGISLLNIVSNADEVRDNGEEKKLKSMITYNDGAQWSYLTPPAVDSEGNKYSCNGKLEDCSLNLHSFTERVDPGRDTYSSYSAIGMLFGLGNVGSELKDESDGDTALFFTKDAGATWKEVKKGQYMWEFGDQGTLLVIVNVAEKTNILSYSIDEGDTWTDYQFATDEVQVYDIATVTADTSSKFLVLSRSADDKDTVYVVDFSGVYDRQCYLDFDDKGRSDDFEYWTLKHPFQADNCLFGREQKYLRRKADHTDCFIGAAPLSKGFESTRQCACARTDFECDYNYVLDSDGTCKLVKGLSPIDERSH
ncbi:unnamed protein product [Ambrosiozyma monospora]|uniref:Unnamed protein product n=1 Tax=Ambrosiozyma monospora TaxID=43982 RepID=A0ACB5T4B1_AMBMO|nr:unnamed protein product [Ambrosiozyma monospora]